MSSSFDDLSYDPEILNAIEEAAKETGLKRASLAAEKWEAAPDEGQKKFSDVFWAPSHIPDIPITEFNASDWPDQIRPYIPDMPKFWVWPQEQTEMFALAMFTGDRTLLHGPTGSGKSALPQAWCAKLNIPLLRMNCHRFQDSVDFLGSTQIKVDKDGHNYTAHEDTVCTLAAKHGGLLNIDEAFRGPALMAIQALLEKGGSLTLPDAPGIDPAHRRLTPPDGKFWLVLTDNTNGTGDSSGSYVAEVQDLSSLDRITATIAVPYMDAKTERAILRKAAPGLPKEWVKDMVSYAGTIRAAFTAQTMMQTMSLRALLAWAEKAVIMGDLRKALILTFASKLSHEDRVIAGNAYHQVFAVDL